MIVADEHGVDVGQIISPHPRFSSAPRTYPGHRTGSFRPDWIRQNVGGALLNEHGRVVHQCESSLVTLRAPRWNGLLNVRDEIRRWLWTTTQLPAKKIEKPGGLRRIRIMETPSVKVLWESSIAHTFRVPTSGEHQTAPANTEGTATRNRKG